jgi:DUF1365 family protein
MDTVTSQGILPNGLLVADVAHARKHPGKNAFHYHVYYLCFALQMRDRLRSRLLSLNRFNLFSFYDTDHRNGHQPAEAWIRAVLAEWNVTEADGAIVMLTLPRVLGYVFNPVSFWFCLDSAGNLRAVLSEVNNTFGDHHSYISFRDDHGVITQDEWLRSEKIFHVSPFMAVEGHYLFRFVYSEEKVGVWIHYYKDDMLLLTTSVTGKRMPLTARNLLYCFFRYPLVTLKVIGLIHYQAVRLLFKGARYHPRPIPPVTEISR